MRLNKFFGSASWQIDFNNEIIKSSDKDLINQIKNVLRLKAGNQIILCDGKLNEATCFIEKIDKDEIVFKIIKVEKNQKEFNQEIVLYCSVLKRENFELVVQKAVELGVARVVPVITARTVKLGLKQDRLEKIIKEAAEQSGRGILPILSDCMDFRDALEDAKDNDLNILFEIGEKSFGNAKIDFSQNKKIGVFIGPEGGRENEEVELVKKEGFEILSFSPFILRAETAAIAGLAILGQTLICD